MTWYLRLAACRVSVNGWVELLRIKYDVMIMWCGISVCLESSHCAGSGAKAR